MGSCNCFNPNKAFFVIDSQNCCDVKTQLYGFTLLNGYLVEDAAGLQDQTPGPEGSYVYINRCDDQIVITQDYVGSYGLYLFQKDGYFALSNSFLMLVDYVKTSHSLTYNYDYAYAFSVADLCSVAYSETIINEIRMLDRSAVVSIDVNRRAFNIQYVDYKENTVDLDSAEGFAILDKWYDKWSSFIRNLASLTKNINIDLSGGMDSRMTLVTVLGSQIDLDGIRIYSIKDTLHTHREDYEIASSISEHFGFTLNHSPQGADMQAKAHYTIEDALNISFCTKLGFHKQMYWKTRYYDKQHFSISGDGGECIRNYWKKDIEEYIHESIRRALRYNTTKRPQIEAATQALIKRSIHEIREKFIRLGRELPDSDVLLNLYRETRCRNHFGKNMVENYFSGMIRLAPLLDPDLHRIRLNCSDCLDKDLLMAVIFSRYHGDLLKFKFDSKRSINPKTIVCALRLNKRYPRQDGNRNPLTESPLPDSLLSSAPYFLSLPDSINPQIDNQNIARFVSDLYHSSLLQSYYIPLFDENLYRFISLDIQSRKFHPLSNAFPAIAASKYLADTLTPQSEHDFSLLHDIEGHIPASTKDPEQYSLKDHPVIHNYICARLDITITGADTNSLEVNSLSDLHCLCKSPPWLNTNGYGYSIESIAGKLDLSLTCRGDGTLLIKLMSRDVRSYQGNRIPIRIDYTSLTVNGKSILDKPCPAWHDVAFHHSLSVHDGDVVELSVHWVPHDPRTDYTPPPPPRRVFSKQFAVRLFKFPLKFLKRLCRKIRSFIS